MSFSFSHITKCTLNCCRLVGGYMLSSLLRRPWVKHLPYFLSVEPVNVCNLRCPQCPTGMGMYRREKSYFNQTLFQRLLHELGNYLLCIQFYFQGEPLLCPTLCEMIKLAKSKGIYTIVSTNAQLLDDNIARALVESGLDKLIVSMDGLSQEAYATYRVGGDVNKVLKGMKYLSTWKKYYHCAHPKVELQWLVLRTNEHEMKVVRKRYKSMGADKLSFKTAQFYSIPHADSLMPMSEKYNRYRCLPDGTWILKRKLRNRCWRLWAGAVIDVEGNVRSCCFDKGGEYLLGNLHQQSFKDIWTGVNAQTLRKHVLRNRSAIKMCRNCTE